MCPILVMPSSPSGRPGSEYRSPLRGCNKLADSYDCSTLLAVSGMISAFLVSHEEAMVSTMRSKLMPHLPNLVKSLTIKLTKWKRTRKHDATVILRLTSPF